LGYYILKTTYIYTFKNKLEIQTPLNSDI
jgi:hypothetical protein